MNGGANIVRKGGSRRRTVSVQRGHVTCTCGTATTDQAFAVSVRKGRAAGWAQIAHLKRPSPDRSAVAAAAGATPRRVPHRRPPFLAAGHPAWRPRSVDENLDLPGIDELLQLRMFARLRSNLTALSGAEM